MSLLRRGVIKQHKPPSSLFVSFLIVFQPLPALLCHQLGITEKESAYGVPTHLHCFELTLADIERPKRRQILIQAPLPEYFTKTLERLQLVLPEDHTLSKVPELEEGRKQGSQGKRNTQIEHAFHQQGKEYEFGTSKVDKDLNVSPS